MVSNNSSGMCCGVSQNTYHTLKDMRVVFADGTVLDTADSASRSAFLEVCTLSSQTLTSDSTSYGVGLGMPRVQMSSGNIVLN